MGISACCVVTHSEGETQQINVHAEADREITRPLIRSNWCKSWLWSLWSCWFEVNGQPGKVTLGFQVINWDKLHHKCRWQLWRMKVKEERGSHPNPSSKTPPTARATYRSFIYPAPLLFFFFFIPGSDFSSSVQTLRKFCIGLFLDGEGFVYCVSEWGRAR